MFDGPSAFKEVVSTVKTGQDRKPSPWCWVRYEREMFDRPRSLKEVVCRLSKRSKIGSYRPGTG